jgi:hypothetical protein
MVVLLVIALVWVLAAFLAVAICRSAARVDAEIELEDQALGAVPMSLPRAG